MKNQQTKDKSSFLSSNVMKVSSHFTVDICVFFPCRPGEVGKRKHICHVPGCEKTFRKTSLLRAHVRLHTGERPFVCNWVFCGKRFTRSDELQRHARTHTGDRERSCEHVLLKKPQYTHVCFFSRYR